MSGLGCFVWFDAVFHEELVIRCIRVVDDPGQFKDGQPFVKSVLSRCFFAQMPFAVVGFVVIVRCHFCDGFDCWIEQDVVFGHSGGMWIQSRYQGGARWRAYGLRAIGVFKDQTLVGEGIHVRRLDPVVAIARHGVGALLIGDE